MAESTTTGDSAVDAKFNVSIEGDLNVTGSIKQNGTGMVPNTRKVNGKALSSNIELTASDVKARPETWTPTASDVKARPETWTPTAAEVKALAKDGTAAAATKLETARTIQTNLGSSSSASFDGTKNVAPGVTGTLPISMGGTGKNTPQDAADAIITAVASETMNNLDSPAFIMETYIGTGGNKTIRRVSFSEIRNNMLNRNSAIQSANTDYTTSMARGISLHTYMPTTLVNGAIYGIYS